jgi:hypothetical protein
VPNGASNGQLGLEIEAKVTPRHPGVAAKNKLEQITFDADQKMAEAQGRLLLKNRAPRLGIDGSQNIRLF